MTVAIKTETELYAPVKSYFEQLGYHVRGEVHHCDLVAIRGEEPPVIVELKKNFSIPLLLQGINRLRLTRQVYVAFELPNKGRAPHGASWPELRKLCQMLGVGMITVQFFKRKKPAVLVECHPPAVSVSLAAPSPAQVDAEPVPAPVVLPRHNKRAAERIVHEFKERRADYNVGGSTRLKLMTSYREKSLHLAYLLHQHGPLSPRRLRELTGNPKAAGLLQKNFYRWFQRVERGIYRLTPQGEEALLTYANVIEELPRSNPLQS
ncbi:MAG: putative phosphodiesterase [Paenibacillus sp.]|nr:putative phosphodiesterase [Paenibacillus sp.]